MSTPDNVFAKYAPLYREAEYWPRPVKPGTKFCPIKNWNQPDPDQTLGELNGWLESYASWGIGLVLGSPFADGTKLAAVDIDHDDYVRAAAALLKNPICGRIGAKGIAYPVRLRGDGKYRGLKVKGKGGYNIGEILCDNRQLVLPPTIHPETQRPYTWVGRSLLEVDYRDSPLLRLD